MVRTLLRSALREIRQSLGRYLAILAIVGLGVGFFAGLRMCQPAMMATGVDYIERQQLHDFRLISSLGFTAEDVEQFAALEGVAAARGAVFADFLTELDDGRELVLKAHSLTEDVNLPRLTAGRLPETAGECVGDARYFSQEDLGSPVKVSPGNDEDTLELLRYDSYTLVGLAWSPYYLNYERGTSSIGSGSVSGFVYIPEEGFDFDAYYEIFLSMEDSAPAYSDAYGAQVDAWKPAVEALLDERAEARYDSLYSEAMEEIRDAEREIADGWDEYRSERTDAEGELDDAYRELTDGEQDYEQGRRDYEQGRRDYEQGRRDYADGQQKVADAEKELADAEQELADGERDIADARRELDDGWAEYEKAKADAEQELADAYQKLTDGEREYADGLREYNDGVKRLEDAAQELADGERELADAERKVADGEREIADGERELAAAEAQLSGAAAQLADARRQLEASDSQLRDAKAQLDQGESAYQQLQSLYSQAEQAALAVNAKIPGASYTAETLVAALKADPALAAAVPEAGALVAGWDAASAQMQAQTGAPLSAASLSGLRSTLDQSQAQYQSGLAQYNEGLQKYRAGQAEYESGAAQAAAARQQLADGRAELERGRRELADGRAELEQGRRDYADGQRELDDAKAQLADARRELDEGWAEYNDGKREADEELAKAYRELTDGEDEWAEGVRDLEDGRQKVTDGRQELDDAKAELTDAEKELADAKAELDKAPSELADARQELDEGWSEYNDGRAEADEKFADAEKELTDAEKEVADAYETLRDLKHATTYALTREENTGYVCFDNDTSIVAAISVVFPVFFFLVAALVCMTTMTRMVDEQRTQIGVLKAMGYSNGQIISKYLFYAGSAALAGSILGYALGSTALPWIIWEIYALIYGFAPLEQIFLPDLALISLAAALLCSMGATYLSCRVELSRQAAELIRPKTPRAGRRVFLEYIGPLWRRLSFLHKVSVRNVLRYQSRLVMMVLGIGGCTALLCTGFGIRDSIASVADDQFGEITLYDYAVTFQDGQTQASAAAYLRQYGWDEADGLLVHSGSVDVAANGASKSVYLVVSSTDSLEGFLSLHSGEEAVPYPGPGEVVLNRGLAENMGISQGDAVRLRTDDLGELEATVSAISDNYVFNYAYVSEETFLQQAGEAPEYNALYVLGHEGADPYEEGALLLEDDKVSSVTVNEASRAQVDSMLSRLDYIVVVVVLCAAALAFIVLYNLTNINITERIREIATIKVLGFYQNEVAAYVFREINILSLLGSLAGLGMGKALHAFVMDQIQIDAMFFACRIAPLSYVLSLCMTMLFTVLISAGMRPRLRRIDMAESLKSIE